MPQSVPPPPQVGEKSNAHVDRRPLRNNSISKHRAASLPTDVALHGEAAELQLLGYRAELHRNRSAWTLLFQIISMTALPFGEGGPFISAIYGGGQLSIFVGWIVVSIFAMCVAISLAEIASRYPTSGGPPYWAFQLVKTGKVPWAFIVGWIWLVGNWTTCLSVNFGFASLIGAMVSIYHPDFVMAPWQLLLVFYAVVVLAFFACAFANRLLPMIDTICAIWTLVSILAILIALAVTADVGRNSAAYALGHYDDTISGWRGFSFFIGLLPPAYTFTATGFVASMAEEVSDPTTGVPIAMCMNVLLCSLLGFFFILPICVTMPPLADIVAGSPLAQALPYIYYRVMGTPGGALGLIFLVLGIVLFCAMSITNAASRATWAFARDNGIPLSAFWSQVSPRLGVPINALLLLSAVQMLLGLINLGSSTAFTAFVSAAVIGTNVSYGIPIGMSLLSGRHEANQARWNCGKVAGAAVNVVAVLWIAFEVVLFSMPIGLPVTATTMNYASVVFVGFFALSVVWYVVYARRVYQGPPASDGIGIKPGIDGSGDLDEVQRAGAV